MAKKNPSEIIIVTPSKSFIKKMRLRRRLFIESEVVEVESASKVLFMKLKCKTAIVYQHAL